MCVLLNDDLIYFATWMFMERELLAPSTYPLWVCENENYASARCFCFHFLVLAYPLWVLQRVAYFLGL